MLNVELNIYFSIFCIMRVPDAHNSLQKFNMVISQCSLELFALLIYPDTVADVVRESFAVLQLNTITITLLFVQLLSIKYIPMS